jgi:phospholipid N-methyltransferase
LKRMDPDSKLLAFEINEVFSEDLHKFDDSRFVFFKRTAEDLLAILAEQGIDRVDYVVSALPFTVMPDTVSENIVTQCRDCMRTGGKFIQVHYSLVKKGLYKDKFGNVKVNFILKNLPPAFLLISNKS